MFKKISLLLIAFLFTTGCFLLSPGVHAEDDQTVSAGLTPGNLFYFLDSWGERISLMFTFNDQAKAEKALGYAEEKIAELEAMSEKEKEEVLEEATKRYDEYLVLAQEKVDEIKGKGVDTDALSQKMAQNMVRHQENLMRVYDQVPEQAKGSIEKAMQQSQKHYSKAIGAIDSKAVKEQMKEKLKNGQGQGKSAFGEQEKQKMDQARNRVEEIVKNGISEEEWEQGKQNLIELVDTIEEMVKEGISEEGKQEVLSALNQVENAILANQSLTEEQKATAVDIIAQVQALIESGLTPTQRLAIVAALEELKSIINQIPMPESGQAKDLLRQGTTEEQKDALNDAKGNAGKKMEALKGGPNR